MQKNLIRTRTIMKAALQESEFHAAPLLFNLMDISSGELA